MKNLLGVRPVYSEAEPDGLFRRMVLPFLRDRSKAVDGDLVGLGIPLTSSQQAPGVRYDQQFPFIEPMVLRKGRLALGRDENIADDAFASISAFSRHLRRNVHSLGPVVDAARAILDLHDFETRHQGLIGWVLREASCVTLWEFDNIFATFPYGPSEASPERIATKTKLISKLILDAEITTTELTAHRK